MRKLLTFCFMFLITAGTDAQTPAGYSSYYTKDGITTAQTLSKSELKYIRDVSRLLSDRHDFSFIQRISSRQWIGISKGREGVLLLVHDSSAKFNCRAKINMKSGAITVLKGVDYRNKKNKIDADLTAKKGAEYFSAAINGRSLFSTKSRILDKEISIRTEYKAEDKSKKDPLKLLMEGNERYASGLLLHPNQNSKRRSETGKSQHPFAIIVSCSDSRVPPELIFDQGVGDLFIVRNAGEVVDQIGMGSIEYAAEHLHSPLIMILAHERCGAVDATVKGGEAPGSIKSIVEMIAPAVTEAKKIKGDILYNSIVINSRLIEARIEKSEIISELVHKEKIRIVKGYYDLDSGRVKIIE